MMLLHHEPGTGLSRIAGAFLEFERYEANGKRRDTMRGVGVVRIYDPIPKPERVFFIRTRSLARPP